jgi:hypothetical protein
MVGLFFYCFMGELSYPPRGIFPTAISRLLDKQIDV